MTDLSKFNSPKKDDQKNQPGVNDIIMRIEMKKFKKILENPESVKNNLLNIDTARLYPLCAIQA